MAENKVISKPPNTVLVEPETTSNGTRQVSFSLLKKPGTAEVYSEEELVKLGHGNVHEGIKRAETALWVTKNVIDPGSLRTLNALLKADEVAPKDDLKPVTQSDKDKK